MFGCTLAYLTMLYTDYAKAAHFGAVAVFLAWMELTLLTGRQTSEPTINDECVFVETGDNLRQVSCIRHLRLHERARDQDADRLPPVLRHLPPGVHLLLPPPLAQL